jgi:SAM-dependent methyltransferase
VRGVPDDLAGVVEHYERMSGSVAWTRFVERLRQWQPAARNEPSAEGEPGYTELVGQHHLSLLAGNALAATLDLSDRRRVLDLGGGTGAMSIALCRKFPALRAIVLEFPGVAAWTREFVAASGCLDRIEVAEGDLTAAEFPAGCDVVLCANLLSLFGAEENRTLLERVFEYLPAGGLVVLSGWMLDRSNHGPLLPLLLSLEDIALGAGDVERSTATYAEWLTRAGFERVEDRTACEPTRVVVGRKPIA